MTDSLIFTEPCPTCGATAVWYGEPTNAQGTTYRIDCQNCDEENHAA